MSGDAEEGGAATKSAPRTPTNAEARPEPLAALLSHTAEVLAQSEQELRWLTNHPLWLPTALAPLFSSLRWQPAEIAYLLAALLSDQKVLLHSEDPHRLYHATCALKALISPLSYGHIFIPLLPTLLMSADEAEVLLVDCSTPYLIGCETSLLASFGTGALPSTAVVVSLDRGIVRRAPGTDWFDARAPPFASLCAELQRCMGGGGQPFRGLRAQAACLRFVVDVINIPTGFLASSPSPCDADALSRIRLLEAFAADAHARCKQHRSGLDEAALGTLEQSLYQSTGYLLAQVCAEAATRHHGGGAGGGGGMVRGAGGATAGDGGAGGGGDACRGGAGTGSMGALGEWNALIGESVEAVGGSAARSSSCCLALSKLYEAGPFREWWGEAAARTGADSEQAPAVTPRGAADEDPVAQLHDRAAEAWRNKTLLAERDRKAGCAARGGARAVAGEKSCGKPGNAQPPPATTTPRARGPSGYEDLMADAGEIMAVSPIAAAGNRRKESLGADGTSFIAGNDTEAVSKLVAELALDGKRSATPTNANLPAGSRRNSGGSAGSRSAPGEAGARPARAGNECSNKSSAKASQEVEPAAERVRQ